MCLRLVLTSAAGEVHMRCARSAHEVLVRCDGYVEVELGVGIVALSSVSVSKLVAVSHSAIYGRAYVIMKVHLELTPLEKT